MAISSGRILFHPAGVFYVLADPQIVRILLLSG
jgi:hypothetical protein